MLKLHIPFNFVNIFNSLYQDLIFLFAFVFRRIVAKILSNLLCLVCQHMLVNIQKQQLCCVVVIASSSTLIPLRSTNGILYINVIRRYRVYIKTRLFNSKIACKTIVRTRDYYYLLRCCGTYDVVLYNCFVQLCVLIFW